MQWSCWKHTYLNWFFWFFGLRNQKTYIFKYGFWVFFVLDTSDKISMSWIRNCKIDNRIFLWGVQNPKNPKNPLKNMYVFWLPNPKNPKNQFKYVCFQRDMPETINHSNILRLDVIRCYWKLIRSELERKVARIDCFPYSFLLKTNQIWAGSRSGQNW